MYTMHDINAKLALARAARLSGWRLLENRERARSVCNGIGAWWMPDKVRKLIGTMAPDLVIVADIHDLRCETGGRWYTRWAVDFEFFLNGVRMALYRRRPRVILQALRCWFFLIVGSWTAFRYRHKRR